MYYSSGIIQPELVGVGLPVGRKTSVAPTVGRHRQVGVPPSSIDSSVQPCHVLCYAGSISQYITTRNNIIIPTEYSSKLGFDVLFYYVQVRSTP